MFLFPPALPIEKRHVHPILPRHDHQKRTLRSRWRSRQPSRNAITACSSFDPCRPLTFLLFHASLVAVQWSFRGSGVRDAAVEIAPQCRFCTCA